MTILSNIPDSKIIPARMEYELARRWQKSLAVNQDEKKRKQNTKHRAKIDNARRTSEITKWENNLKRTECAVRKLGRCTALELGIELRSTKETARRYAIELEKRGVVTVDRGSGRTDFWECAK